MNFRFFECNLILLPKQPCFLSWSRRAVFNLKEIEIYSVTWNRPYVCLGGIEFEDWCVRDLLGAPSRRKTLKAFSFTVAAGLDNALPALYRARVCARRYALAPRGSLLLVCKFMNFPTAKCKAILQWCNWRTNSQNNRLHSRLGLSWALTSGFSVFRELFSDQTLLTA
jgi:hypothetical protein